MVFSVQNLAACLAAATLARAASLVPSASVSATTPSQSRAAQFSACTTVTQRKAWHTLSDTEKKAYIDAELCLFNLPAKEGYPGAVNRFDDLHFSHINSTNVVHDVGGFLPWHRYYMYTHETILKNECNYTGTQPYWDLQHDSWLHEANASLSDVFDPVTGFGGDGVGTDSCIADGPFANVTLHLGPDYEVTDHCLSRSISTTALAWSNLTWVNEAMAAENYSTAYPLFSAQPHMSGHATVGGVMLDIAASPGDPLFYLHHTNLDRLWWNWQSVDLDSRLFDMAGRNVPTYDYLYDADLYFVTDSWLNYDGDNGGNVTTLNHTLSVLGLLPNVTVGDVMNIQGGLLCYEYIQDTNSTWY